jgi:hypothetical protein
MSFEKILCILILLAILALTIYIAIVINPKKNETFTSSPQSSNALSTVFSKLYAQYLNQEWPIVSTIASTPPLLNVAYPDSSIIYYVASFNSSDTVTLSGKIPPNIYFWSLTLYNSQGLPTASWNYTSYPENTYNLILGPNNIVPPSGNYCVIQRVYQTSSTPTIYPNYVPTISIQGSSVIPVSSSQRTTNSNSVQNILWNAFNKQFSSTTPTELFPTVNINQFFLPSQDQLASVFPNPFAKYLIVYPETSNVIKVQGTLPQPIGYNNPILFISFMASNMDYSSTDNSIPFTSLPTNYTLYVAYSVEDAQTYGYNSNTDKLLLWNSNNTFPVLVYREVSASSSKSNDSNSAISLFTINNQNTVSGSVVSQNMGPYYPVATTFNKGTSIPTSSPMPYGKQNSATTSSPMPYGKQNSATTSSPMYYGKQNSATTSSPMSYKKQNSPMHLSRIIL